MKKEESKGLTGAGTAPATGSVVEGGGTEGGGASNSPEESGDPDPDGDGDGDKSPEESGDPDPDGDGDGDKSPETEALALSVKPIFALAEDVVIVVCGTKDTLPLLDKAWEQKAAPARVMSMNIDGMTFREIIEDLMADDGLPDTFVLVPAGCFPTHRVSLADLISYKVRMMKSGERRNATGLPALIEAATALEVIEKLSGLDSFTEEEFMAAYNGIAHADEVPVETGHFISGSVCFFASSDPCPGVIAEALARRKFISVAPTSFPAMKKMLTEFYG